MQQQDNPAICVDCGRERTADDIDYAPTSFLLGGPMVGWYSGADGELCPQCLYRTFRRANGGAWL